MNTNDSGQDAISASATRSVDQLPRVVYSVDRESKVNGARTIAPVAPLFEREEDARRALAALRSAGDDSILVLHRCEFLLGDREPDYAFPVRLADGSTVMPARGNAIA